jgi:hypothetical protein
VTGRGTRCAGVALLLAAALAGCGGDDDEPRAAATATPTATATSTPTPTATPDTAPPPRAPRARAVRFRATDGQRVSGQYVPAGRNAPAVVLLHEIRGGPDQWDELVPYLHEAGFATLAYKSRSAALEADRLPDALGALRWLRGRPDVDRRRLALVGASIGASTAVLAMATGARATADAVVALSPPDSADIWSLQDDGRYRPHDVLFISDERESTAVEGMFDGAVRSEAMQSEGPGHGVTLLAEPGVRDALLRWLEERVR